MLMLTRGGDEALTVGDEIRVNVIEVNGNQVRFGIEAPREVALHREEVYKRIKREKG